MTPNEIAEAAKLWENLAKMFGASAGPVIFALWVFLQTRKTGTEKQSNPFAELQSEIKGLRVDISEVKERVAKIEGGLGL